MKNFSKFKKENFVKIFEARKFCRKILRKNCQYQDSTWIFQSKPLRNETDYPVWRRKMRHLLDYHEGASDVIEGKLKAPEVPADNATPQVRQAYMEQADLFRRVNSYAMSMITSAVSDEVFHKIMDKDTAVEAW